MIGETGCSAGKRTSLSLSGRAEFQGLTALVAQPQMGKSWALQETARRLSEKCSFFMGNEKRSFLVGFAGSFGETSDLLLRAITDLYQRWLEDTGYWQQARMVWDQQKKDWLPGFAKLFAKVAKDAVPVKPLGTAVKEFIDGLLVMNETLVTGGLRLPTLQDRAGTRPGEAGRRYQ